jgi:hypothetical protein
MPAAMHHARTLLLAALAAATATPAIAQENAEATLVAAERAFEALSIREGVKEAFIQTAHDSAIIFRPEPVNAIQSFRSRPASRIGLRWHPALVRSARSGDLGFTTGPSQVLDSAGTVVGYGNYVSVWKMTPAGWRWVIDLGIGTPQPAQVPPQWTPRPGAPTPRVANAANDPAAASLVIADNEFSARAASAGFAAALQAFGDPGMWLLRDNALPHVGLPAALAAAVTDSARRYSATPKHTETSEAGDLGWSWGEYRYEHPGAGRRESGHYVRIWAREGDRWRLLLDITAPRPAERDE